MKALSNPLPRGTSLASVLLLAFLLAGCLTRTRTVERRVSTAELQTATLQQLVESINTEARKMNTLNATVDIATTVGRAKKSDANQTDVTDYQEIRGYILLRKPEMLRMIGLFPVVRNRAFDMVSDGETFKLSIPVKNKFIVGRNDVVRPSKQPLENLRPHHILDALLLHEIDSRSEFAVLEGGKEIVRDVKTKKEVDQPTYEVLVIARNGDGHHYLARRIIFSRVDLLPHRQIVYDKLGNVATIATYENFQNFEGINFPQIIKIERPLEQYSIQLGIVKLRVNEDLKDDQFALQKPADAELVRLDSTTSSAPPPGPQNGLKNNFR